jgi:hypothetical protein
MKGPDFAYFPKSGPLQEQVASLPRGLCIPTITRCGGTRDIGSNGLRRGALRYKIAASLDRSPCEPQEQVARPSVKYIPKTARCGGTRDIGSNGLRRVALRYKIAASPDRIPREIPRRDPIALVAWWSAETQAPAPEANSRSGQWPQVP